MAMPKPKTDGHYLKAPKAGQSLTLRILGDPVEYYIGFKTGADNKISVTRRTSLDQFKPGDYDAVDKYGRRAIPAYCMAFPVLTSDDEVKVCEFRQKTILDSLYQLENNKKWGDLTTFDVTITGDDDGKGYSVTPDPKTPASKKGLEKYAALVRNGFNLNVLLNGDDPFMVSGDNLTPMRDDIANPDFSEGTGEPNDADIPF